MSTFQDVIPLIARQTDAAKEVLFTLHSYFYTASLNGTHLQNDAPADAEEVRRHMHERADFLHGPNAMAFKPPLTDLNRVFEGANLAHDRLVEIINAARGAMSAVIDRSIRGGISHTDDMRYRDEASTEATFAAARVLGCY